MLITIYISNVPEKVALHFRNIEHIMNISFLKFQLILRRLFFMKEQQSTINIQPGLSQGH